LPYLFSQDSKGSTTWALKMKLDEKKAAASAAATGVGAARQLFQNKTARGQSSAAESDTLWTLHENAIIDMHDASPTTPGTSSSGQLKRISTVALDGRLSFWDLSTLSSALSSMHL
jgi:hypothetical protein